MDSKNVAITVLTISAVMLFCTLLIVGRPMPQPQNITWADSVDRGGDYVLATGSFSDANEALYVLDGVLDRLDVYQYDRNERNIVRYDGIDLVDIFSRR